MLDRLRNCFNDLNFCVYVINRSRREKFLFEVIHKTFIIFKKSIDISNLTAYNMSKFKERKHKGVFGITSPETRLFYFFLTAGVFCGRLKAIIYRHIRPKLIIL